MLAKERLGFVVYGLWFMVYRSLCVTDLIKYMLNLFKNLRVWETTNYKL